MKYNIEPIFVLFPLVCLFFHFTKKKNNGFVHLILILIFILIYSFSLNGSDIGGYKLHYNMIERGVTIAENDQEIGFYYLMKFAVCKGVDYLHFRVLLLSGLSLLLFYVMGKITKDLPLSMFFITSMFIIYTISSYRQYIVIVFSILWIYLYSREKKILALIGTSLLLLFHITALLPLGCMVYELYNTKKRIKKTTNFFKNNYIVIILFAIFVRFLMIILLQRGVLNGVVSNVLGKHASSTPTPVTFGLFSRLIFLLAISYMFQLSKTENLICRFLFGYYFVSIIFYVSVPLEFLMGRLINNAHILCSVLIPLLRKEIFIRNYSHNDKMIKFSANFVTLSLEIIAIVILINQLTYQNGYTPYLNVFLRNTIMDIPAELLNVRIF